MHFFPHKISKTTISSYKNDLKNRPGRCLLTEMDNKRKLCTIVKDSEKYKIILNMLSKYKRWWH